MKTLYHGSNVGIEAIDLHRGRRGKDFGQGFYLSDDFEQASEMARIAVAREGCGTKIITSYEFDDSLLLTDKLKVLRFDSYTEEWARFIFMNRKNKGLKPSHDYDFVYGPIADDRVGVQLRLFEEQYIPIQTLVERLKYIKPTFQYFFGTEKGLRCLTKKEVIEL